MTDLKTRTATTVRKDDAKGAFEEQPREQRGVNAALIDAVEVTLYAQLGGTTMTVADLAALTEGSVVTLDTALNAAVELRLNGVTVARGELVAVGDNFAVRLTELG